MEAFCCAEEYCEDRSCEGSCEDTCASVTCDGTQCGAVEYCEDQQCPGEECVDCESIACVECEDATGIENCKGEEVSGVGTSQKDLADWACEKEGCQAIQQYVRVLLTLTVIFTGSPLSVPCE